MTELPLQWIFSAMGATLMFLILWNAAPKFQSFLESIKPKYFFSDSWQRKAWKKKVWK